MAVVANWNLPLKLPHYPLWCSFCRFWFSYWQPFCSLLFTKKSFHSVIIFILRYFNPLVFAFKVIFIVIWWFLSVCYINYNCLRWWFSSWWIFSISCSYILLNMVILIEWIYNFSIYYMDFSYAILTSRHIFILFLLKDKFAAVASFF